MVGFEESRSHYDDPGKVVVTGTPVRTDFFRYTRKEARAELGLTDDRPLVLSVWGSLGAEVMNCQMAECIALECRDGAPFHHIHGAGRDYRAVLDALQGSGLADHPEVDVREYIYDMPLVMAAADLVLCRAGASTIAEIAAIAKPAVLVPSPNVVADHQTKNARVLANAGGAVLLPEGESSGEKLYALMTGLLSDAPRREAMSRALRDMAVPDAAEQIYQTLVRLMENGPTEPAVLPPHRIAYQTTCGGWIYECLHHRGGTPLDGSVRIHGAKTAYCPFWRPAFWPRASASSTTARSCPTWRPPWTSSGTWAAGRSGRGDAVVGRLRPHGLGRARRADAGDALLRHLPGGHPGPHGTGELCPPAGVSWGPGPSTSIWPPCGGGAADRRGRRRG